MKKIAFIILLFVPAVFYAQELKRVTVKGVVTAPIGEDLEGISVYNISSQKGTITDEHGAFAIGVAVHDRVLFTALQFQKFTVIVDEGIVETKQMKIYVNPAITQLDEVIVRPHDLTGNINVDVSRIQTVDVNTAFNLSWEEMEFDFEFSDDRSSGVENIALDEVPSAGLNLLGIAGLIGEKLFRSRSGTKQKNTGLEEAKRTDASYVAVYQRFANTYFTDVLKIPEDRIENFLYYIAKNGFTTDLLKENNELKLMDFLDKQSKIYLAASE